MDSAPVASTQYAQYKQFPNTYREPTNDEWLTEVNALRQRVQELEQELEDFESDIDTCTQHNVELQLEVIKLTAERDNWQEAFRLYVADYERVCAERDELLVALERVSLELGIDGFLPEWEFVYEAIASVKGQP